jgi:hypothetical protein
MMAVGIERLVLNPIVEGEPINIPLGSMPHDGAIIFRDLLGKLPVLHVACSKCDRNGHYLLFRLIKARGYDAKVIDWLDELTAD